MDKVHGETMWIGDVDDLDQGNLEKFDFILNLSNWCDSALAQKRSYAHVSIADGGGNYRDFETAAELLLNRLQSFGEENVLVNCAAGVSRSVAVASAVTAVRKNQCFEEGLERVRFHRSLGQDPHPELVSYGERFVEKSMNSHKGGNGV